MTNRSGWRAAGVAVSLLVAVPVAAQTGSAPEPPRPITDPGDLPGPRQPIFFRHDVHARQYQIPCLYCHSTVTVSSEPGVPSLQTCMGCHFLIPGGTRKGLENDSAARNLERGEIQKLLAHWRDRGTQPPPEWIRIHDLPDFVQFPHMRHVKALGEGTPGGGAATCTLCHGDVQTMAQVYQVESLKMGWCIRCHVERNVSRDCTVCHY